MNSTLDRALEVVRRHEGGKTNDPHDPGGPTAYGWSLRTLETLGLDLADVDRDGDIDADDVSAFTWEHARALYIREFWDRLGLERLPADLAVKLFDSAVNLGPRQAVRLLQRALRACLVEVQEDGVLGPVTIAATRKVSPESALLTALRAENAGFYRRLVARNPDLERYLEGWIRRAYS